MVSGTGSTMVSAKVQHMNASQWRIVEEEYTETEEYTVSTSQKTSGTYLISQLSAIMSKILVKTNIDSSTNNQWILLL